MNKKTIDKYIPYAYDALKETKIADQNGHIDKKFRGQISSFGAAVTTGSLKSAVAFFSNQGSASVHREYLTKAMLIILKKDKKAEDANNLWEYVDNANNEQMAEVKENIMNAAIALKLAMNLFTLDKSEG